MTKYKDNNTYSQNNTNSALERYAMEGYTPPAGVVGKAAVKEMQRWLGGLTVDGMWGPKTQKQFDKAMATVLKTTQVPPAPADAERLGYAEDLYKLSLGIGKSGLGNYMVRGYDPPANIKSAEDVRAFQETHGLDVNGVWGRRTQQKFDQLQQQWAGQYDIDEIARLVAEGLNKLTGAAGSAAPEGVIPLGTGKETGIIQMSSGSARPGQIMGAQTGAKPVTSSAPTTMENRAAKGYTIPQGVDDVAAAQRMLGVEVDGVWGGETDRAYKKLVSGGGNPHISSAQAVAAQLKQLYQDVAASNLSAAQKENARALLLALEQYGDPEYQRKTLLGIQMKGGAAAFFKQPSGPAWNAMIDTQNELYEDLLGRLEQKKNEIAQIPIWERIFSNAEYKELQSQRTELEEQIMVVDKRLRQPGWNVLTFWDWSEVDDWERAQLIRDDAKNASAEKQARDEAAAEAKAEVKVEKNQIDNKGRYMSFNTNQLRDIGWKSANDSIVTGLNEAIVRLNLNTPEKVLYFLATIAHESNSGEKLTQSGTNWKYRGSGYIQITGEKRYRAFSQYMNDPDILNKGADYVAEKYPWESAIWYWDVHRNINAVIDAGGDFAKVTEYVKQFGEPVSDKRKQAYENIKNALFADYDID